jgi:DNA-directed RNA polymerase specialized sigma24 family protein
VSGQVGYVPSSDPARQRILDERQAFADMYEVHAAYVFDYCHAIVGNRDRAAAATQATLIAAHSLSGHLQDHERQRAWLMALARRECQDSPSERAVARESAGHARRELAEALAFIDATDDDVDDGDDDTSGGFPGSDDDKLVAVRGFLHKLSTEQREILSLVYRYGIDTYELPAILGIDAASVAELLTDAEERFTDAVRPLDETVAVPGEPEDWSGDDGWVDAAGEWVEDNGWAETPGGWADEASEGAEVSQDLAEDDAVEPADDDPGKGRVGLTWLTAVPLTTLPASVWRRTSRAVLDPKFRSYRDAVRAHAEHLAPDGFPVPIEDPVSPSFRRLVGVSSLLAVLLLAPAGLGWAGYAEFGSLAASKAPASTVMTSTSPAPSSSAPANPAPSVASSSQAKVSPTAKPAHRGQHTSSTSNSPVPGAGSSSASQPTSPTSSPPRHSSSPSPEPSIKPPSPTPTPTPTSPSPSNTSSSTTTQTSSSPAPSGSSGPAGSPEPSGSPSPASTLTPSAT